MNLNKALEDTGESTPFIEFMLEIVLKIEKYFE
jgi:hypothetical protein